MLGPSPNITGSFSIWLAIISSASGCFSSSNTGSTNGGGGSTNNNNTASFKASSSSSIYKSSVSTVQPASIYSLIMIKA